TRQIHTSLHPMEVGYVIANEGRRLVDCDRVSVAMRRGRKTVVEAISGADVVERRSNLVRLMAKLFDNVLKWGEKLIYQGIKDDSLPPGVLKALDAYLAESNSKLLAKLQDGLGGKARAIMFLVAALVALLIGALVFIPYPLKMEAKGQLLPIERQYAYSPREGQVVEFKVIPGQQVSKEDPLAEMYDLELERQMGQLQWDIDGAQKEVAAIQAQLSKTNNK